MTNSGDAAESIVRMSLQGVEVAAKITGAGAKNIAILLYSILKEEKKTKGKSRLSNMLRSGKELKVFTVRNEDLKKFQSEAKRYGVLYCVLKDKEDKNPNAIVDVIARGEDASKISRIIERFNLVSEGEKATIVNEVKESVKAKKKPPVKDEIDSLLDDVLLQPNKEKEVNPLPAVTEKSPPSEQKLNKGAKGVVTTTQNKPSVREKIKTISAKKKEDEKVAVKEEIKKPVKNTQTIHTQPKLKKKRKGKSR